MDFKIFSTGEDDDAKKLHSLTCNSVAIKSSVSISILFRLQSKRLVITPTKQTSKRGKKRMEKVPTRTVEHAVPSDILDDCRINFFPNHMHRRENEVEPNATISVEIRFQLIRILKNENGGGKSVLLEAEN